MALLDIKTSRGGYIGKSSGSSLLKVVHTLLRNGEVSPPGETSEPESDPAMGQYRPAPALDAVLHINDLLHSSMIAGHLMDSYFRYYNRSYPIIHENSFRETYRNMARIPDESSWHFLFYTVLAVGAYASNTNAEHQDEPFYQAARARMSTRLLESGTLIGVQAFLLMVS
jgi:transcriptional regulatory protein GAL4